VSQCKDISTDDVLRFLAARQGVWCYWYDGHHSNSVYSAMPTDTPPKLILAKMRQMKRAKLVSGCCCGCRGDFEITDKGLGRIGAARTRPMIG
jgi:hypothetical protein